MPKQQEFLTLPNHIAFIIDGNGRWAKQRGMPRSFGHRAGIKAVEKVVKAALKFGLKQVSFFCFSTENWNRPKEEVDELFRLFRQYLDKNLAYFQKQNIRFHICGKTDILPYDLPAAIQNAVKTTAKNSGMIVNLCINYGGRQDIVQAVNLCLKNGVNEVDEKSFANYLSTATLSDPDFIVRTSGEMRLSNFFLYQAAYAELYFPKVYWPDFDGEELRKALMEFQGRNRRFGSIKE